MITKAKPYPLLAAILAGGKASRMKGRNKATAIYQGRPMFEYALDAFALCEHIVINSHHPKTAFPNYEIEIIPDLKDNFNGPLAGVQAVLTHIVNEYTTEWLITCPCDAPHVSRDFVEKMWNTQIKTNQASLNCRIFVAASHHSSNIQLQPVFALIHTSVLNDLNSFLDQGNYKPIDFYKKMHYVVVSFENIAYPNLFTNINTLSELKS